MGGVRVLQSSFSGGELTPDMYARTDVGKYQTGVKRARNVLIRTQGGVSKRNGFAYFGDVADSAVRGVTIPMTISEGLEAYVLEFGHQVLRFIRDGAYVLDGTTAKAITSVTAANPAVVTATAHGFINGQLVYLTGMTGAPDIEGAFYTVSDATTNTFTITDQWGAKIGRAGLTAGSGGTVTRDYRVATPYASSDLQELRWAQDQNRLELVHASYAPRTLTRVSPASWTLALSVFGTSMTTPAGVSVTPTGTGPGTHEYKVTAISDSTGEESLPSASVSTTNNLNTAGNKNTVAWSAVAGASRYVVYKLRSGAFAYIGTTTGLSFEDDNIVPDQSNTAPENRTVFASAGEYPSVVTFHEQRIVYGRTINDPGVVSLSQTANPKNFNRSPVIKATDALGFRIRGARAQRVNGLLSADALMVFTGSGEWEVTGSDNDAALRPDNIRPRQRSYRGSTTMYPLQVGDTIMFEPRGGGSIRDYASGRDVKTTDITILSEHFFAGRHVVSWGYQQSPNSVVWVVLDDGSLLTMTYILEHDVWGWTKQELGGANAVAESVSVVSEADGDAVYVQTARTVNGLTRRSIERLSNVQPTTAAGAEMLDAHLVYDGDETDTLYGLRHLENEQIVATIDGLVQRELTVMGGKVVLPVPGSRIVLGLPYTARVHMLALDIGPVQGQGSLFLREKSVTDLTLLVKDTLGMFVSYRDVAGNEVEQETTVDAFTPALYTGKARITPHGDWEGEGEVIVGQTDPLPFNLLAVLPDWTFANEP